MRTCGPIASAVAAIGAMSMSCALLAGLHDSELDTRTANGDAGADSAPPPDDAASESTDGAIDAADAGAPFSPSQLGVGLVVWLDAAKGVTLVGGKVAKWADQSSHANDAAQADAARQPGVDSAIIAQRDAIKFDGVATGLSIADDPSLRWALEDFTIEIIAEYTNPATGSEVDGYGALWTKGSQTYPYPGPALFANSIAVAPTAQLLVQLKTPQDTTTLGWVNSNAGGLNDGKFHLFGMRRTGGTTLEARVDGAPSVATVGAVDVSSLGEAVWIGSAKDGTGQLLKGDVAEVIAYHGALTNADLADLEAYLKRKYRL